MSDSESRLIRVAIWLGDTWLTIVKITVAVLLGVSAILQFGKAKPDPSSLKKMAKSCQSLYDTVTNNPYENWALIFLVTGTAASIIIIWLEESQKKRHSVQIEEKEEKINELNLKIESLSQEKTMLEDRIVKASRDFYDMFEMRLATLAKEKLKLDMSDRVSVYRHYKDKGHFQMIGRYSPNASLGRNGRVIYPDGEGYIGMAWQHGKHYVKDLPKCGNNKSRYISRVAKEANIDKDVLASIKMPSRCYYARTIKDMSDLHPIAVIVIESNKPDGVNEGLIDSLWEDISQMIKHELEQLGKMEPNLIFAQNHGL